MPNRASRLSALGPNDDPDVLPFSNLPAVLAPFLLRPNQAMTLA